MIRLPKEIMFTFIYLIKAFPLASSGGVASSVWGTSFLKRVNPLCVNCMLKLARFV